MSWKKNNPACPCCGCPEPHLCVAVDWLDNCHPPGTNGWGGGSIQWPVVTSIVVKLHSDGSILFSCAPDNAITTQGGCCFDVSAYLGVQLDITVEVEDGRRGVLDHCAAAYSTSVTPTGTPCTLRVPVHSCAHGMVLNVAGCQEGGLGVGFTNQNVFNVEISGCDDFSGDIPTGTPTTLGYNVDAGCCTDETSWSYTITPTCRGFAGPITVGPVCLACAAKLAFAPLPTCAPGYFCSCGRVCWPNTLFYSDDDGFSGTLTHGSDFGGGWTGTVAKGSGGKDVDPYGGCLDSGAAATAFLGCAAHPDGSIVFTLEVHYRSIICQDGCIHYTPTYRGNQCITEGQAVVPDVCAVSVSIPMTPSGVMSGCDGGYGCPTLGAGSALITE
jgi:hypothetical protein